MLSSIARWVKNLPRIGKIALILVVFVALITAIPPTQPDMQPTASEQAAPAPVVTTETITETEVIPFAKKTREDGSLPKSTSEITTAGIDGEKTFTYEVTTTDGKETSRKLVSEDVTTEAQAGSSISLQLRSELFRLCPDCQ